MTSLEGQLREMYGRAAYTHKTHEKMADGYIRRYRRIKSVEIWLSALATGSLLLAVFGDSREGTIVGAVLSTILLGLTLYFREAMLGEQAQKHTVVGSKLWGVREALLYAMHLEKGAVDYYGRVADGCAGAPMGALFQQLLKEETRHLQALEDLYEQHFLTEN